MLQTFKKEVEAGVGDVIGHTDVIELKKDPQYCRSYRKFRRFHGLSSMLVVTSLMCNTVYLYYLTLQLQALGGSVSRLLKEVRGMRTGSVAIVGIISNEIDDAVANEGRLQP
ncbi:transmembrane protein 205-like isoform x2 [Plakobranchus ocellatus]|uniref:Transmembrane protein 205-like isoform x2 n=1 Tax=Plakobranchus ocellatus TaxID=259542 RepID=A0AAV4A2E8_9GAST|nr:transmembrane protein 205-like isoform x2 [Plakobranchus ocellatus]